MKIERSLIVALMLLLFVFLGCGEPPEQGWQWVEVSSYGGKTETNAEFLYVYSVNGLVPELWTKGVTRHDPSRNQKMFAFSKSGEQVNLPVEVYEYDIDGVLRVSRNFKYENSKVYVQLVYNLPKD